jgi:hypothetical protein
MLLFDLQYLHDYACPACQAMAEHKAEIPLINGSPSS